MFIFIRLLLAHFIGDFPLQFGVIYRLKYKGIKGIVPHALIIFFSCIIMCWPYLHLPKIWLFIGLISFTHLLQDSAKLDYGSIKHSFWTYLIDQLFHVGIIATIFFTDLKKLAPPLSNGNIFIETYNNNAFILYLIAIIIATYNGFYLIRCFKNTFLPGTQIHNSFDKWFGMVERAAIVSVFLIKDLLLLLLILIAILLLRPVIFLLLKERKLVDKDFLSLQEIILSYFMAVLTGFILNWLIFYRF